jgi:hypothetical protein
MRNVVRVAACLAVFAVALVAGGGAQAVTTATPPVKIDEIQGSGQFSPKQNQAVSGVQGIVTAIKSTGGARGFFVQDPQPDADPGTSEGIFVFTGSTTPSVSIGDAATVAGTVREFISSGSGDLPETELVSPTTTIRSSGNALPAPVVIGQGGLQPPTQSVADGIAFDESLEGMLVQLDNPRAVSRVDDFGEVWVVPDSGAGAGVETPRGGILLQADDANPEKFRLASWTTRSTTTRSTSCTSRRGRRARSRRRRRP